MGCIITSFRMCFKKDEPKEPTPSKPQESLSTQIEELAKKYENGGFSEENEQPDISIYTLRRRPRMSEKPPEETCMYCRKKIKGENYFTNMAGTVCLDCHEN